MTPGSWYATSACGTWLWWPCRPRRGPTRRGAGLEVCRWHTDWRGQGRSILPEVSQPACLDEMTWPSERTFECPIPEVGWDCMDYVPVSLYSPKFLVILSTRRASCKDVLFLGLNPSCSPRISSRSFTRCKILASRIFSNNLAFVSKRLMGR